jgi:hypothetical protein
LLGGQAGSYPSGDNGGYAGAFGLSSSPGSGPSGSTPGGTTSPYYNTSAGLGATSARLATAGYAAIVINTTGTNVHDGLQFNAVQQTYVKSGSTWQTVRGIWVKDGGIWKPVAGSVPPPFGIVSGTIGVNSRPWV